MSEKDTAKADEIEKVEKPEPPTAKSLPKPADGGKWFYNSGTENVFTEGGRCMPNQAVQLTADQAKQYKSLKPCP